MELTENVYDQVLLAYEQKKYDFIEVRWRQLSSEERIDIICKAYKDKISSLLRDRHFVLFPDDIQIIQDKKMEYADKFGLSNEDIGELYWWNKHNMPIENRKHDMIIRNVALVSRLSEYDKLVQRYGCLSYELIKNNPNLLKCDSRRTESRIKFLLEQNEWEIPSEVKLSAELTMQTRLFNYKHQKEIEKVCERLAKGSVTYEVIADLAVKTPDFSNDKFLELALRVIYGDNELLSLINKRYEKRISEIKARENERTLDEKDSNSIAISEDITMIEELFDDAFPVDEGAKYRTAGHKTSLSESKPNNKEALNEKEITVFLQELKLLGIECKGYINSNSGEKGLGEEQVRYYVLKKGNYVVLEPIGQVGNSTLIFRNGEKIEELKAVLGNKTKTDLIKEGIALKLNHHRTENQSYHYSVNRVQNMFTLIEEFSLEKEPMLSLSSIKASITKMISANEVPEVSKYIWELSQYQAFKLASFVVSREQEKGKLDSLSKNTEKDILADSTANSAEEVEI